MSSHTTKTSVALAAKPITLRSCTK